MELGNGFSIYEIAPLPDWIGHTLKDANIRAKYHVNIIGIKTDGNMNLLPGPDYVFEPQEHLMMIGHQTDIEKIVKKL